MKKMIWLMVMMICATVSMQAQESMTSDTVVKSEEASDVVKKVDDAAMTKEKSALAVEETGTEMKKDISEASHKEAIVHMPGLTKESLQKAAGVLKKVEGIENLKPDMDAKNIHIIYSGKIDFDKDILEKLKEIDPDVKLLETKASGAVAASKCGGCPNKSKCAGAAKAEAASEKTEKAGC